MGLFVWCMYTLIHDQRKLGPSAESDPSQVSGFRKYLALGNHYYNLSNFYFLVFANMSCAKFSPQSAFLSFMPLVFVVSVSLVTEALEDLKRHREDNEVNSRQVNRFNPVAGVWESIASEDICVGDIIQITDADPEIPAYILLLKTSLPHGICNIETSNLDGETDLKIKQADIGIWSCECSEDGLEYPFMVEGYLESEPPNPRMDSSGWSGTLTIQQKMVGKELESPRVGMGQLVLRGCPLHNTEWIIGLVVFTGIESKIILNNKEQVSKRISLDLLMDKMII
eukprot:93087_1